MRMSRDIGRNGHVSMAWLLLLLLLNCTTAIRRPPRSCDIDGEERESDHRAAMAAAEGSESHYQVRSKKLFENERCIVMELTLAAGEEGVVADLGGQGTYKHHMVMQVGRGVLKPVGVEGAKDVELRDGMVVWDPFRGELTAGKEGGLSPSSSSSWPSLVLRNMHDDCESRSIFVGVKDGGGERVWRGEEVRPGRRFEEEDWEEQRTEDALREEEERVLQSAEYHADIGNELLLSNEEVRVWSFVIKPGEDAPIHRHENPYLFINLGESRTCGMYYNGTVQRHNCGTQGDGLVTWIDCSVGSNQRDASSKGREKRRLKHVHGVRNVGTTWFRQFIVEFLKPPSSTTT